MKIIDKLEKLRAINGVSIPEKYQLILPSIEINTAGIALGDRDYAEPETLIEALEWLLGQLRNESDPPGWDVQPYIWLGIIEHKHGTDVYAAVTEAKLYEKIVENYEFTIGVGMPPFNRYLGETPEKYVDRYFTKTEGEWLEVKAQDIL